MSSSRRRSRSGCAAVSAVSSETASACAPTSRSMSSRVSRRVSRHSSRRVRWASAYGPGTEASTSPSHRSRASASRARAAAVPARPQLLGPGGQLLGGGEVERGGGGAQGVAAGLADQDLGAEGLAEPGGVGADRREGLGGRFLAPERVDQLGGGGGAAAAQEEGGEQGPLLRRPGGHGLVAPPGPYGPEHPEAEGRTGRPVRPDTGAHGLVRPGGRGLLSGRGHWGLPPGRVLRGVPARFRSPLRRDSRPVLTVHSSPAVPLVPPMTVCLVRSGSVSIGPTGAEPLPDRCTRPRRRAWPRLRPRSRQWSRGSHRGASGERPGPARGPPGKFLGKFRNGHFGPGCGSRISDAGRRTYRLVGWSGWSIFQSLASARFDPLKARR